MKDQQNIKKDYKRKWIEYKIKIIKSMQSFQVKLKNGNKTNQNENKIKSTDHITNNAFKFDGANVKVLI